MKKTLLLVCVVVFGLSACGYKTPYRATTSTDSLNTARTESARKQHSSVKYPIPVVRTYALPMRTNLNKLSASQKNQLTKIATLLKKHPHYKLSIEGYAWNHNNDTANRARSLKRARALQDYITTTYGIATERIFAVGFGPKKQPTSRTTHTEKNQSLVLIVTAPRPSTTQQVRASRVNTSPKPQIASPAAVDMNVKKTAPKNMLQTQHTATAHDILVPNGNAIVLCYHNFDLPSNSLSISSQKFKKQIEFMLTNGYNIISMDEFTNAIASHTPFPEKSVVITLDDGWRTAMSAYKILKDYNLPFTIFLSMKYVGHKHKSGCLSKADIEELKTYPKVTFANHSYAHSKKLLRRKNTSSARYEKYIQNDIAKSVERFEQLIGSKTKFFAYPFGRHNPTYVAALQKAGFEFLFTVDCKLTQSCVDPLFIPRVGAHKLSTRTLAALFKAAPKGTSRLAKKTSKRETPKHITQAQKHKLTSGYVHPKKHATPAKNLSYAPIRTKKGKTLPAKASTKQKLRSTQMQAHAQRRNTTHASLDTPELMSTPLTAKRLAPKALRKTSRQQTRPAKPAARPTPTSLAHTTKKKTHADTAANKTKAKVTYTKLSKATQDKQRITEKFTSKKHTASLDAKRRIQKKSTSGPGVIRITAVGDIMMGTTYPSKNLPPKDGKNIFSNVAPHFTDNDLLFGNLEGPIIDKGSASKCAKGSKHCHEFKMPTRYTAYLKNAGFNVMSIANNHANDFGAGGVSSTLKNLGKNGISATGGDVIASINVKNTRVAFLGFGHNRKPSSHSILDIKTAKTLVAKLKKSHDLVVVSFHGGAEGSGAANVSNKTEYCFGENRGNVVKFAHSVIDAGADMVLGHGPHVLRAMETYKGKFIAYSLGNFLTYGAFNTRGLCGLSVILQADINAKTGAFITGKLVPVKLSGKGIPSVDTTMASVAQIKKLTKNNIPKAGLVFKPSGELAATTSNYKVSQASSGR